MDMWKGSTPTLAFKFPFKTNTIKALTFKCKQGDTVKISKALSDFSTSGENILYILLTQADTLALISEEYVTIQFKVQFTNNHVVPSSKMILPVQDVIDTVAMDGTATAEAPTFAVDVPFPTIDGSFSVVMGMAVVGGASSVAWTDITGKPETFPPSSHTHTKSQITDFPNIPTKTSDLTNDSGFLTSVDWTAILNKPQTFAPSAHNHDDRYYTESETDSKLLAKANQSTLDNTDRRVDALYEMWEGQMYDIDTRTATCYSADVPSGAFCDNVLKIGGKSIVMNQLADYTTIGRVQLETYDSTTRNYHFENPTPWGGGILRYQYLENHKYLVSCSVKSANTNMLIISTAHHYGIIESATTTSYDIKNAVFDNTVNNDSILYFTVSTGSDIVDIKDIMLLDLTAMFGSGNEPSTVEQFKEMFTKDYYAYNAGSIVSAGCKQVVVKDDDGIVISTTNIPQAIQNLTGYGWSAGTVYNEVDYANKKYIQRVGSRAYQSGDENNSTYVTDKTTTYYPLATPIETDISSLIETGFLEALDVESGGTVTFVSDTNDNYRLPVPNTNEYFVSISNRYGGA